jgi:ABC-type multidrug transport system fused ATPase/permease subunit
MFGKLFSKISLFFFSEVSKILAPRFKDLSKTLAFTNIEEDIQTYLSNILFFSFIIGAILEILIIFVLVKLNILFSLFTFILTIVVSVTFAILVFIILYKYPQYIVVSNKKKIEEELERSVKHLSVLQDSSLTVKDILFLLQKIDHNQLLTEQSKKIIAMSDLNNNLKETLKYICDNTYSEQEYSFFSKLIEVLDKKSKLVDIINEYLISTEQTRKEKEEQQRSKITLLFEINIFLFFLIFILVFSVFLMPVSKESIKGILFAVAIIFPIIEFILVVILNK